MQRRHSNGEKQKTRTIRAGVGSILLLSLYIPRQKKQRHSSLITCHYFPLSVSDVPVAHEQEQKVLLEEIR